MLTLLLLQRPSPIGHRSSARTAASLPPPLRCTSAGPQAAASRALCTSTPRPARTSARLSRSTIRPRGRSLALSTSPCTMRVLRPAQVCRFGVSFPDPHRAPFSGPLSWALTGGGCMTFTSPLTPPWVLRAMPSSLSPLLECPQALADVCCCHLRHIVPVRGGGAAGCFQKQPCSGWGLTALVTFFLKLTVPPAITLSVSR